MTSTSLAPPISGTRISTSALDAAAGSATCGCASGAASGAGAAAGAGAGSAASATASPCKSASRSPSLQMPPSLTCRALTTPALGEGISIDALSVSRTIKESPSATVSPTATHSSITSTSFAPPRSGIVTLIFAIIAFSLLSDYSKTGLVLLLSMLNFLMALLTSAGFTTPSSASALSAATTM